MANAIRLAFLGRGTPLAKDGSCHMVINITSEDPKYARVVNVGLWIGAGMWKDREFVIEYFLLMLSMICDTLANYLAAHIGWAEDFGLSTACDLARQVHIPFQC